ncbi:MAG: M23 family metallopeptidase [Solirubrobacterales bacterium]
MRTAFPETRFSHAAYTRVGLLAAIGALAIASLGTAVASAQTGGSTAPGSTGTTTPTTTTSSYTHVFPIPPSISHSYGDGFGASRGKRGHQGVDIFARCGSMLIGVTNTRVVRTGFQRAAGHYLILRSKALRQDYVYYHLAYRSPLRKGTIVAPGQFVGAVGDSGNARGCHLHFELWQGKWYRGGKAVDPLSTLQLWDSYS